ncbi:sulfotransferase family 2 domain-containing protein [Shewanella youngdeokensis]|uniref:Sulfotransferase family 2 domain-containing protein n=1 Tax=Shewanella youngdeokensis TaxID=2999068 RepID=A0ABZ0K318_9GAMM|nr:sulfotransferase family 2 domain-containing protein [Shewanella sp. DAU334]
MVGYRGSNKGNSKFYNHMSASDIKHNLSLEMWNEYFKFTVVRNPFDKMVSAFYHFEKSGNKDKYLNDGCDDISRFRNWVRPGDKVIDCSAYLIDGDIALDYFIRYENLKGDIEQVCKKLGLKYDIKDLPKLKAES